MKNIEFFRIFLLIVWTFGRVKHLATILGTYYLNEFVTYKEKNSGIMCKE